MKIFRSIFAVSIKVFFFFFSLSVAYSWIFYLSATIHKVYMFLFCNSLLVFICLNYHSTVSLSPVKDYGQDLAEKKQVARHCESGPPHRGTTFGEVGDEKEIESLHIGDNDEKAGESETPSVLVEEPYGDDNDEEVAGDDKILLVNVEETRDDELDAVVEYDRTLLVLDESKGDELEVVEDDITLSVIEETPDDRLEMEEDDKTALVVEETQNDELEAIEDETLSLTEETQDNDDEEKEQGGSIDSISLEELNRKCEEFIRRMKEDIRVEILPIQCH